MLPVIRAKKKKRFAASPVKILALKACKQHVFTSTDMLTLDHRGCSVLEGPNERMNPSCSVVLHTGLIVSAAPEPYVSVLSLIESRPG